MNRFNYKIISLCLVIALAFGTFSLLNVSLSTYAADSGTELFKKTYKATELGSEASDISADGKYRVSNGKDGHITFGANTKLPAGKYRATLRAAVTNDKSVNSNDTLFEFKPVGVVDLIKGTAFKVKDQFYDITSDFTLDAETTIEFRYWFWGARGFACTVESVTIEEVAAPTLFKKTFNAKDLNSDNSTVSAEGYRVSNKNQGHITWGGDTILKAGKYKATINAKVLNDATANSTDEIMSFHPNDSISVPIKGTAFKTKNEFKDVSVEFTLQADTKIEIRYWFWGNRGFEIAINTITIEELNTSNLLIEKQAFTPNQLASDFAIDTAKDTVTGKYNEKSGNLLKPKADGTGSVTLTKNGLYQIAIYANVSNSAIVGRDFPVLKFKGTNVDGLNKTITGKDVKKVSKTFPIIIPLDLTNVTMPFKVDMLFEYAKEYYTDITISKVVLMDANDIVEDAVNLQEWVTDNILRQAKLQPSSESSGPRYAAVNLYDGIIVHDSNEWASNKEMTPTLTITFDQGKTIKQIMICDRPNTVDKLDKVEVYINDSATPIYTFTGIDDEGAPSTYEFPTALTDVKKIFLKLSGSGQNVGLSEMGLYDKVFTSFPQSIEFNPMRWEAENLNYDAGFNDDTGHVVMSSLVTKSGYFTWGGYGMLQKGDYKLVVYAKLLNESSVGDNRAIMYFNGLSGYSTPIKGTDFKKANYYYPIEIPFKMSSSGNFEVRFVYEMTSMIDIKVDRYEVLRTTDMAIPAEQEIENPPTPPAGAQYNDEYVFGLDNTKLPLTNDSTGTTIGSYDNGSLIFSTSNNVVGGTEISTETPFIKAGEKEMRIYVRALDYIKDTDFLKITLYKRNYESNRSIPIAITIATFANYKDKFNSPVPINIGFTADPRYQYTYKVEWLGKVSCAIDRVEIVNKNKELYTGKAISVSTTSNSGVYTAKITKTSAIAKMSPFDYVELNAGDAKIHVSFAPISEYVINYGGTLTVNLSKVNTEQSTAINTATKLSKILKQGYDAYSLEYIYTDKGGASMPALANATSTLSFSTGSSTPVNNKMYGFIYDVKEKTLTPKTSLNIEAKKVECPAVSTNIYLVGEATSDYIISLKSQFAKDFEESANSDTGLEPGAVEPTSSSSTSSRPKPNVSSTPTDDSDIDGPSDNPDANKAEYTLDDIKSIIASTTDEMVVIRAKNGFVLTKDMIQAFVGSNKKAKFEITDETNNVAVIWQFSNLAGFEGDIDLSLNTVSPNEASIVSELSDALAYQILSLKYHGSLPQGTTLVFANKTNFAKSDKLKLLYFNTDDNKLVNEQIKLKMTSDASYLAFDATHCSDYVVAKYKATNTEASSSSSDKPTPGNTSSPLMWILIIVGAAVVIGGAVIAFFVVKNKQA